MKNSLGKVIIFLLMLSVLYAEDFSYEIKVDNQTPYQKEGIVLSLELNQTNPDIVLFFNFDIKKSEDYDFTRLDSIENDTHHDVHVKYLYLLYPLKSGNVNIEFNLIKKVTNDESIAYSYSGDRDNVKGLVTQDTKITLPPLHLEVKSLPKGTLLVGDFKLKESIKQYHAKAYEPIPFNITFIGEGFPPLVDPILPKEGNFTRFTEKPEVHSRATKTGYQNRIIYPMALSHTENFTLNPILFKSFNPKTEKSYMLTIPTQHFEIKKVAVTELVDRENSPSTQKTDWSWIGELFSYLLVFIAGYITATSLKWQRKKSPKEPTSLEIKIKKSKDKKELLQLLLASQDKKFASTIEELERGLYHGKKINFNILKKSAYIEFK
jgi:hypothetical protein